MAVVDGLLQEFVTYKASMKRTLPTAIFCSSASLCEHLCQLSAAMVAFLNNPRCLIAHSRLSCCLPVQVASKVATLATLLALPGPAAGDLLVLQPRLLTQAPETLAANLRGLGAALGVERETAAVLCAEHPSLLLLGAQGTEERLKTLSQVWLMPWVTG
jgi:hypothetical protein